jgi:hypothetical protein
MKILTVDTNLMGKKIDYNNDDLILSLIWLFMEWSLLQTWVVKIESQTNILKKFSSDNTFTVKMLLNLNFYSQFSIILFW